MDLSGDVNSYKGLKIHALTGLHDFVGRQIAESLEMVGRVLDVAAGTGAMSLRLHDMGFQVTATDIVEKNFRLHGSIPFINANLNELFSQKYTERFDMIVAIEIIEHLENPRNFIRECFNLLNPNGKLILSTPNIDSPASIANYIRSGTFLWHGESEYQVDGHITPISQRQIRQIVSETGFVYRKECTYGDAEKNINGSPRLKFLARLIKRISCTDPMLGGDIYFAILEKRIRKSF